jgi:hypothetical protein
MSVVERIRLGELEKNEIRGSLHFGFAFGRDDSVWVVVRRWRC